MGPSNHNQAVRDHVASMAAKGYKVRGMFYHREKDGSHSTIVKYKRPGEKLQTHVIRSDMNETDLSEVKLSLKYPGWWVKRSLNRQKRRAKELEYRSKREAGQRVYEGQIDELSRKTLKAYKKRAGSEVSFIHDLAKDGRPSDGVRRIYRNRVRGLALAKRRLQEASLLEASAHGLYHGLGKDKDELDAHKDHMERTHGVKLKYHGDDEFSLHGKKENVRKAVIDHYKRMKEEDPKTVDGHPEKAAKDDHPHLFESYMKDSPSKTAAILKREKELRAMSHERVRDIYSRHHRVSDTRGVAKKHLITDILRAEHGHKAVRKAYGLSESSELSNEGLGDNLYGRKVPRDWAGWVKTYAVLKDIQKRQRKRDADRRYRAKKKAAAATVNEYLTPSQIKDRNSRARKLHAHITKLRKIEAAKRHAEITESRHPLLEKAPRR